MSLRLGIDVGTSGIRTAVINDAGTLIGMARAAHVPQRGERIDADLWWDAVQTCIRAQVAQLRETGHDPLDIMAIAVDGTSGTMVPTDANLQPVSPALMYNSKGFDGEAALISVQAPSNHITQGSASALGRAMRLVSEAESPPAFLLHQADFIAAKLMGKGGMSDHNNALKTGYDPETERWPDWIDNLVPPEILPAPQAVGAPFGEILGSVAQGLGLSPQAVVHAGTTDSIAAFLAAAPLVEGNAVTSIGSTLAIKLLSAQRIDDPAIGLYAHRLGDIWLVGGASNTGGAVLAHYFSVEEIERLSSEINPNAASGLAYYPLLQPGERFPINDPELQPRLSPRPESDAAFLHGLLEGIATVEERCYRAMTERGANYPTQIFTAGGAAHNEVFSAIRCQKLDAPLQHAQYAEAAIGVAMAIPT